MMDPIERMEAAAERAWDDLSLPGGKMRCYNCDGSFDPDNEGGTIDPSPWAMPVCDYCLETAIREFEAKEAE